MILLSWFIKNHKVQPQSKPAREKVNPIPHYSGYSETTRKVINDEAQRLHDQAIEIGNRKKAIARERKAETLTPAEKDKIIRYGKYWRQANLNALENHVSKPLENAKLYTVKVITDTGDEFAGQAQRYVTRADGPVSFTVQFWIRDKCTIVGTMIYDGEILMQALKLTPTKFQVPGSLTINFNDDKYGKVNTYGSQRSY